MEQDNKIYNSSNIENSSNLSNGPEHHKNARLVLVLVFVILLVIIGAVSYFLIQENNKETIDTNSNTSNESTNLEEPSVSDETSVNQIPEGFVVYEGDGFSFYYPINWGEANVIVTPASDFIGERFYNQNVSYNLDGNYWEYVEDQDFDGEGYAGDVPVLRKSRDITVWGFGFGDAGCGKSDPTYLVGENMVQVTMPIVCAYEDSVSGSFVEGEVEVNLSQDKRINMTNDEYDNAVDTILDSIVSDAADEI